MTPSIFRTTRPCVQHDRWQLQVSAHSTHSRFLLEIMRTKPLNNAAFAKKCCKSSYFAASPLLKERSTQVAGMPMTPLRQMEAGNSTHHLITFHFGNVPSPNCHSGVETRSFVERCQEQPLDQPCVRPCTGPPCPLVCQPTPLRQQKTTASTCHNT
jgi:hypothetical protein